MDNLCERISDAVNRRADDIIEWTMKLIRFPSENRPPDGAEGPAQEFIAGECAAQGWAVDRFTPEQVPGIRDHSSWLAGRNYPSERENVVARRKGRGGGKSLLLSGHADVAPFEPDNWKICRPYEPVVVDGKLYGRGSADMKGGLAAAFWAMRILDEIGFQPSGDVIFESVVDEEFASGNGTLAARLRGHNADFAIVPEPTRMRLCPAAMGAFLGEMTISGSAGMPYMGKAIANPVQGAARAIELFYEWQDKWRAENYHALFAEPGSELNTLLWQISSTTPGEFTQMGTPLFTKLSWIVWCHPGMTEEEFYPKFKRFWREHTQTDPILSQLDVKLERTYHYVRPWETPADDPAVASLASVFENCTGGAPVVAGAPFSCDLAAYGDEGKMPCVLLGPRGGNLHAPGEWVELDDILTLTRVFSVLASSWCR